MLGLSLPPRIKSPAGSCLSPPSQVGPVLCKSGLIGRVEQAERKDQKFLSHLLAQAKLGGGGTALRLSLASLVIPTACSVPRGTCHSYP